MSNFTKIHPVVAKLFHADRWTDMMKLMVACHNFVSVPKMCLVQCRSLFQLSPRALRLKKVWYFWMVSIHQQRD